MYVCGSQKLIKLKKYNLQNRNYNRLSLLSYSTIVSLMSFLFSYIFFLCSLFLWKRLKYSLSLSLFRSLFLSLSFFLSFSLFSCFLCTELHVYLVSAYSLGRERRNVHEKRKVHPLPVTFSTTSSIDPSWTSIRVCFFTKPLINQSVTFEKIIKKRRRENGERSLFISMFYRWNFTKLISSIGNDVSFVQSCKIF